MSEFFRIFASRNAKYITIMARPIRETPILLGDDAILFMDRMHQVDTMSMAERMANRTALEYRLQSAKQTISVCI